MSIKPGEEKAKKGTLVQLYQTTVYIIDTFAQTIPIEEQTEANGTLRWKLNAETCFDYWGKIGTDCNVCMRVCPWSHARTFPHKVIVEFITRNTRVNINSTDSSVNVINTESVKIFNDLRDLLPNIENKNVREKISQSIDSMEQSLGGSGFINRYQEFMAIIANYMTVFAPLIPALTALLS